MGNGRNPFGTGDSTTKKPEVETPPALNYTDIMKPTEKPPEKPVEKPVVPAPVVADRPVVAPVEQAGPVELPAKALTNENVQAEQVAGMALQRYMQLSENGTKAITPEQFKIVKDGFELAGKNAKIDPRTLEALEARVQAELTQVIPDATKQRDAVSKVMVTQGAFEQALQALPDDKKTAFVKLQQTAEAEARQKQTALGHNPALLQREIQKLEDKLFNDRAALSPELGKAMKEQKEFLESKDGKIAAQFLQVMGDIDRLRNSAAMIAFTYAQVMDKYSQTAEKSAVELDKKDGQANKDAAAAQRKVAEDGKKLAVEQLKEAAKNPQVAAMIESSPQGLDLAIRLGVKTAGMEAAEKEAAKLFPELVPFQKANEILVDDKKDAKTRFAEAKKFFEEALTITGRDGRKVEDLRKTAGEIETKLKAVQKEIELGTRKEMTADEKKDLQRMQVLVDQANNVSMVRMQYALALNKHGHEHNDEDAKKRAIEVLKDIEVVDKELFLQSPEIQGALRQAQQGKKIELTSAVSEAFTGSALGTLANANQGSMADLFFPGVQPGLTAALRPTGTTPSDIPFAGPVLFGDKKKPEEAVVRQLAQAYLSNPEATQRAIDQQVKAGQGGLREYGSDAAAVAAGWLTKYGVQRALTKAPGWGKVAGLGLGLATAGLTKDYLADGELGTGTDWLRGSAMFGGSVLLVKGLGLNGSRQVLSEGTTTGIGTRFGVEGLAGKTGSQLSEALLKSEVAAGSRWYRGLQYINPSTYTGMTWGGRYVGFGGERTAAALADGTLSFAGYNARRAVGNLGNTFGMAYAFGAGREGLYIGTGQKMADGTPHTLESALAQMNTSGLQSGLTASIVMPIAGSTFRWLPMGSRVIDGTAGLATRIAPQAAPMIGRVALVGTGPALQQLDHFNNANRLQDLSLKAKTLADEAKQKAEEELKKRAEGPKTPAKK